MYSKIRKIGLGVAGIASAALLAMSSVTAAAAESPTALVASEPAVVQAQMTIDCSTFSEADRRKAIKENINICGALGDAARGRVVADCGVSTFYVDRSQSQVRISYGLFSTVGNIIGRSLTSTWGPTIVGDNYDFGAWNSPDYTNSFLAGLIPSGSQMGGTLRGTVAIAGWTFTCNIVNDDPVHRI